MKKLLLTFGIVCSLITFSNAQGITLGGGLAYGSEIDELGLGFDAEFYLKDNLSISPDLIFYFVDDARFVDRSFWEINANVNYYFLQQSSVDVYGLGGLSLGNVKVKYDDGFNEFKDTDSELGLNLGIGTNLNLGGSIKPFAEFKFTISDFDQAVLFFGVKYDLK